MVWSTANTDTNKAIFHEVKLQSAQLNAEESDQAQDGTVYYAMSTVSYECPPTPSQLQVLPLVPFGLTCVQSQPDISWQIDLNSTVRDAFQTDGVLGNSQSSAFAPILP